MGQLHIHGTTDLWQPQPGERETWDDYKRDKQCAFVDPDTGEQCNTLIRKTSTYCHQCAIKVRLLNNEDDWEIEPQYLEPTPPGMVLTAYPYMMRFGMNHIIFMAMLRRRIKANLARREREAPRLSDETRALIASFWRQGT